MTEFGPVTHISTGLATSPSLGAGPQRPENFWDSLSTPKRFDKFGMVGSFGWRFGVAVTRWFRSTQLLYIEPG